MVKIPERRISKLIPCFEDLNMVIYGMQKVGKTSFLSGDVDSVTIAAEPGSDFLAARPVECKKYDDFIDVLEEVKRNHKDFSGVIIDTVDCLYDLCVDHVCRQLGISDPGDSGYGKGWRDLRKTWEGWLNYAISFTRFRFISHMEQRDIDKVNEHGLTEKVTQQVQRFHGTKARWLDASVNIVGYMTSTKEGKRIITFSQDAYTAAGDRTGILERLGPIELPRDGSAGFAHVSALYRKSAEELGYTLTDRRKKL